MTDASTPDLGPVPDGLNVPEEQEDSGVETTESQILGGDDVGGEDDPADHVQNPSTFIDDI